MFLFGLVRKTKAIGWIAGVAVVLLCHVGFAQTSWLTLKFDTSHLGSFPQVTGSSYGVWSNGLTTSATNVYVSFEWSNAGIASGTTPTTNFSAVIGDSGTLTWTGTQSGGTPNGGQWYWNGEADGSSVMSRSFTVAQMNAGAKTRLNMIQGQNLYIEYGKNSIGGSTPPGPSAPTRYTDVEFTYVSGSPFNNLDFTAINNIGSAMRARYVGASGTTSVGFSNYTSDMLPYLAGQQPANTVIAASSPTATPSAGGGTYVAGVMGASTIPAGTSFYTGYPGYIASVLSGTVEAVKSPLLTNQLGGANPTPSQLVGAAGFTGPQYAISGSTETNWQVAMFFKPTFEQQLDSTYQITLSGSIVAVTPDYASGSPAAPARIYGDTTPLTITIAGGTSSFFGYLANGNVNDATVTLGGNASGWTSFSNDFYQGGGNNGGLGNQAGPSLAIASGTTSSNDSAPYGQIVQRALGDLQELLMIGLFGNTGTASGGTENGLMLGAIPSQNVWQNKSYAYMNTTGTAGFNPIGKYLWTNSAYDQNGVSTLGAVYSNPYDDRFPAGVAIGMDETGGTLTLELREIAPVPEPSSIALLVVAGGTLGGLARRWRRSP